MQRALYRTLATSLLSASALAACATWLSPFAFRAALAALVLLTLVVAALSLRAFNRARADRVAAARWVEQKIPLEQRLLTFASARDADHAARIWPELVADNRTQLPRWADERLGIAAVPANVLLLLISLIAAWLFLVPWYGEGNVPLEVPFGAAPAPRGMPQGEEGGGGAAGPGPQAGVQPGTRGSDGARPQSGAAAGAAPVGALDELQSQLAQNFERSLGGQALQGASGKQGDGAEPQGERGAVAESGLGKSQAEEGGRVPDEQLARREQDDGTGQAVRHQDGGEGGPGKPRPKGGERGRPSDPKGQTQEKGGPQAGGRAAPGGDAPAEGPLALGNEDGTKQHAGGAGAGSGKATGKLLADKPLTLDGGRHSARFALTLGGATGKSGDGPKAIEAMPKSRIAQGAQGPQEAARSVRHEEIPAEYEAVVKRIFKRDP